MDPSLEADLRGAPLPRLHCPADDLGMRDEVRLAPEVGGELALGERAEAAPEVADVRVLHVPGDDVGDDVAVDLAPQPVGGGEDALALLPARPEQPDQLVLAQVAADVERHGVPADDERHFARLARRPRILPRQAERVRGPDHARQDGRVEPFGRAVPRVHRQPGRELEAAALGRSTEQLERRPRGFRVDVVDRHRRDAAPVVDPRVEQGGEVVRQVRGRLHRNLRRQDQPRCRNRPQELVERRLGRVGHQRSRLGPEVLDDHLLDLWTGRCDRSQGLESLLSRLADPDQDPGREGHLCHPGEPQRLEAERRKLVRRAEVRPAAT